MPDQSDVRDCMVIQFATATAMPARHICSLGSRFRRSGEIKLLQLHAMAAKSGEFFYRFFGVAPFCCFSAGWLGCFTPFAA